MSGPDAAQVHGGTCAIVGLPNVGKSTLLNRLVGRHLVAVSPKPQTTRNRILGIHRATVDGLEPPGVELCLVDTPGIQQGKGALRRFMRTEALTAAADADVSLLVIDAAERRGSGPGRLEEPDAVELLTTIAGTPLVVALNKVDRVHKPDLLPLIERWSAWGAGRAEGVEIVPISASAGDNVDALVGAVARRLPVGPPMFPADMITDRAEPFLASELIREQLFHQLGQELPYSAAVVVERFEEHDRGDLAIGAFIAVERESQKAIVIGKGGARIKELGVAARAALTDLFGVPVHLSLLVKIAPAWTSAEAGLRKLGYRGES